MTGGKGKFVPERQGFRRGASILSDPDAALQIESQYGRISTRRDNFIRLAELDAHHGRIALSKRNVILARS